MIEVYLFLTIVFYYYLLDYILLLSIFWCMGTVYNGNVNKVGVKRNVIESKYGFKYILRCNCILSTH